MNRNLAALLGSYAHGFLVLAAAAALAAVLMLWATPPDERPVPVG